MEMSMSRALELAKVAMSGRDFTMLNAIETACLKQFEATQNHDWLTIISRIWRAMPIE